MFTDLLKISYNFYIFMPEIFLTISLIMLLTYGVIFSKIGGLVSQLKKITNISILILIITLYIIINLYKKIMNISLQNEINTFSDNIITGNVEDTVNNMYLTSSWSETCLKIDPLILIVKGVIILSAISILILSQGVLIKKREKIIDYEYTILILLSTLGMLLLISSKDLIVMYLSIETVSLSLYILAAIRKTGQFSTEAGLKYFILGALSSGLLLFGSTLIYISTGLIDFDSLAGYINNYTISTLYESNINNEILNIGSQTGHIEKTTNIIGFEIGAMFICFAIFFKLAVAPFHMWAPDVYEGSPTIITAFFGVVPKIAILMLLVTLIYGPFLGIFTSTIKPLLIISAILSIIIGSIGALNQTKIKRLFAYSAIGHIGFIILGLAPGTITSLQASFIYIILYIIMTLNTFAFILSFYNKYSTNSTHGGAVNSEANNKTTYKHVSQISLRENVKQEGWQSQGSHYISELSGLSRKEPVLAITFALGLLSIAGIPPLAGFFSKYLILLAIVEDTMYIVATISIVFSVIACFYYIRLIQLMYFKSSNLYAIKDLADIAYSKVENNSSYFLNKKFSFISCLHLGTVLVLGITFYIILTFIFYPNPLLMLSFDTLINTFI